MKPIFVKYSNERKTKFQIKTIVNEDIVSREKKVIKEALFNEGNEHIQKIKGNYELLIKYNKSEKIRYIPYKKVSELAIEFPYISGVRLSDTIVNFIKSKKYTEAENALISYFQEIKKSCNIVSFQHNESHMNMFGDISEFQDEPAFEISNLDIILDNVIFTDDYYEIIDYEWVFDFSIPVGFIGYRILNSVPYFDTIPYDIKNRILEALQIKSEQISTYEKMDKKFQEFVTGDNLKLNVLYDEMNINSTDIRLITEKHSYCNREICTLDSANNIIYESKEKVLPTNSNIECFLDKKAAHVCFNLIDSSCIMRIDNLTATCGNGLVKEIDDDNVEIQYDYKSENLYYFYEGPVYLLIENHDYAKIELCYSILFYDDPLIKDIINMAKERDSAAKNYNEVYNKYLYDVNSKNKEILDLGDKVSELKDKYDDKTSELNAHVQLLNETRDNLLKKHDECQSVLSKYNDLQSSYNDLETSYNIAVGEKSELEKKLHYILNVNPIKALKYISDLKKRESK